MTLRDYPSEYLRRRPFQGVLNIVRFNYEFFFLALIVLAVSMTIIALSSTVRIQTLALLFAASTLLATLTSLAASWYIYDHSELYSLTWLDPLIPTKTGAALNIHAGFDETSHLIHHRYSTLSLDVIDFYDPLSHTERSIKRARKAYPAFPGTKSTAVAQLNLPIQHYQAIFLILAIHEIRKEDERIACLTQLRSALAPGGRIIVVEHARDIVNFIAYTIGFFHFLPPQQLIKDFSAAGLRITHNARITPFVRLYSLQ